MVDRSGVPNVHSSGGRQQWVSIGRGFASCGVEISENDSVFLCKSLHLGMELDATFCVFQIDKKQFYGKTQGDALWPITCILLDKSIASF